MNLFSKKKKCYIIHFHKSGSTTIDGIIINFKKDTFLKVTDDEMLLWYENEDVDLNISIYESILIYKS